MSSEAAPASSGGSIESLRLLKEVETDAEARVQKVRADAESGLKRLKDEAEAAVHAARADANAHRESALAEARKLAEAEASKILNEGRQAAQRLEVKSTQAVSAKRDGVLGIVLGEFRGKGA
jgi:vacuolar-type H+-ATPase subunit H